MADLSKSQCIYFRNLNECACNNDIDEYGECVYRHGVEPKNPNVKCKWYKIHEATEKVFTLISFNFTLESHISRFKGNVFKLPKFQRGFVWTKEQTLQFADSLIKGYPVSSLTFAQLERDSVEMYVLDGQQRLLSLLFLCHKVFPNEKGRIEVNKWFNENPIWESLEVLLRNHCFFESFDNDLFERGRMNIGLPSVELHREREVEFDEYWMHIKECFKRLNLGGTVLSENEIERLLNGK